MFAFGFPFLAIGIKWAKWFAFLVAHLVPFSRLMQMGPPPFGPFLAIDANGSPVVPYWSSLSAIVLSNGVPIMHLLISTFVWMELTMMYRSAISIAFPHSGKEKSEERIGQTGILK